MEQLKNYILSQVAKGQLPKEQAKSLLLELADRAVLPQKDIAIIGMGCRFSNAKDTETFWEMLKEGINCIQDFPEHRIRDIEHILTNPSYSEFMFGKSIRPEDIPHLNIKAGYLNEIDKFDAPFFGIPPTEATFIDPNQRMALEVAWEAMEDAGYGGEALVGSRTGIYIGREGTNYSFYRLSSAADPMQLTGSWESLIVSRISYLFDFKGPCMMIDTACSGGLVSVHMAVQALQTGECDIAIAGGMNLNTTGEIKPRYLGGATMENVEAEDGRVKTFDASANGTVWGEGVGLVLLKPLHRALEDGDSIRAIIKASAINNDGKTNSLTAPNAKTQEEVTLDAWHKAGIPPETISYIEAHGTGTVLGDPIEVKGLTSAFRRFTKKRQFCAIGSLKTNMGHMVAASGTASLIKVVKSMEHKELPPIINFRVPNPYINFTDSPLYINDMLQPWETNGVPRRAGINSFGFSRTNCHMVIEEAPALEPLPPEQPRYCLTVSAKNQEGIQQYLQRYTHFLDQSPWNLADLCYTSNLGRGHYEYRTVVIASTEEELREKVKRLAEKGGVVDGLQGVYSGFHRIVSEKKKVVEVGEISGREKNHINGLAMLKLKDYLKGHFSEAALLEKICCHYIEGADIDWKLLYEGETRRRIPIPVYPLQRIRFWAKPKISKVKAQNPGVLHPLVERELPSKEGVYCYETTFCIDRHWVLSDHRIKNKAVLPGTSYLEMVRFAAARAFRRQSLEFRDVLFLIPLVVEAGTQVLARLNLTPIDQGLSFSVASHGDDGEWIPHVEGRVYPIEETQGENIDLDLLKTNSEKVQDLLNGESDTEVFQFGPHWDTIRAVWQTGLNTLAQLQLSENLQSEVAVFHLHPSLLDNGVNLTSQSTGDTFLPFMYKSFKFYRPFTRELYSHIRPHRNRGEKGETMTYDVELTDPEGNILADISNYAVKRVHDLELTIKDTAPGTCLQMAWTKLEEADGPAEENRGPWALIATQDNRCQELEEAFTASGLEVQTYYLTNKDSSSSGKEYTSDRQGLDALLTDAEMQGAKGIVFSCDYTMENVELDHMLASHQLFQIKRSLGVDGLFQLCKCILNRKSKWPGGLKVLVRDAWAVDQSEAGISPLSAASAALGRVIGQEYRHLNVTIVDSSSEIPATKVIKELFSNKEKSIKALRPSGIFVEELRPHRIPMLTELPLDTEGVYLISGGTGGLGLSVAGRLADKGKARVVLLGRRALASAAEWETLAQSDTEKNKALYQRLMELKARLGSLEYVSLDVADNRAVQMLGKNIKLRYGKISGIIHAAGVAGDGFLMAKDDKNFHQVMDPKLDGSMNLMGLLPQDGTGFMVLFSSITALTGGEGQGDYSAANAFLDSLADAGAKIGIKIISINWPSWREVGMSVNHNLDKDANLFEHISVADGLDWLESLIMNPQRRIVPSVLNRKLMGELAEDMPFRLSPEISNRLSAAASQSEGMINEDVKIKGAVQVTDTQRAIGTIFAAVLGLREIDIYESFQDMGGNSLMSTQLLKLIEKSFQGMIDISDIFSYPSVSELSEYIDSQQQAASEKESPDQFEAVAEDQELRELLEKELEGTEFLEMFLDQTDGGI